MKRKKADKIRGSKRNNCIFGAGLKYYGKGIMQDFLF